MRRSLDGYVLAAVALAGVTGCSEAPRSEVAPLEGRLEVIVVEGPRGSTQYFLMPDDGSDPVELTFDTAPAFASGTRVAVGGTWEGERFRAAKLEPVATGAIAQTAEALSEAAPRMNTIAFVLVDYGDGLNVSEAEAERFMYSTTQPGPQHGLGANERSVVQYYAETSFGRFTVGGAVEGPLSWTGGAACNGSGGSQLAQQLNARIATEYDHYIWYYGSEQPNCGYGWGSLGSWSNPSSNVWFNGDLFDGAITHEIGHNLGYQHASSIRCSGTPLANDPQTCTTTEYGSTVSVMGNLSNGHMMGLEKWYSGWFRGCNGVRVRSSGTFTLHPIETPCGGIQTLQVPMPVTTRTFDTEQSNGANPARFYYLEYRTSTGLDTGMTPAVMVHASDDIRQQSQTCARSVLMDMNPSTNQVNGMTIGSMYSDPAGGVSFSVTGMTATTATVSVTVTTTQPSTCMDGTTLVGSGPPTCAGGMGGTGGMGGMGGMAGMSGMAGRAGAGGSGGTSNPGGTGGGGGSSGLGGAGGMTAGSGGAPVAGAGGAVAGAGGLSAGAAGVPGGGAGAGGAPTAGATSVAGSSVGGSAAGVAGSGPGGSAGSPGIVGPGAPATELDDGCGCVVPGRTSTPSSSKLYLMLAALGALALRSRRTRRTPNVVRNVFGDDGGERGIVRS
jgi:hypothetical protein